MRLARRHDIDDVKSASRGGIGLFAAIGEKRARSAWSSVHEAVDNLDIDRLLEERMKVTDEIKLHRELALQLIDLGYRALATRLVRRARSQLHLDQIRPHGLTQLNFAFNTHCLIRIVTAQYWWGRER
jgi:hypothetical protein